MTAAETTHKIIEGISKGIDFYGLNFPAIKFFKPIIMRMADKYIDNLKLICYVINGKRIYRPMRKGVPYEDTKQFYCYGVNPS